MISRQNFVALEPKASMFFQGIVTRNIAALVFEKKKLNLNYRICVQKQLECPWGAMLASLRITISGSLSVLFRFFSEFRNKNNGIIVLAVFFSSKNFNFLTSSV